MKTNRNKLICVVGATASGKTGLGVALAKSLNGEIISADSRQVYRHLDVGTGKEGQPAETALISNSKFLISNKNHNTIIRKLKLDIRNLKRHCRFINDVPQWLIDICEPEERFTMFDWLELAKIVIDDVWKRGKVPIVVGGTGLYVQALIEGFTVDQTKEQKNRRIEEQHRREDLEGKTREELAKILIDLDEEAFLNIDINNPVRSIRAIERAQSSEKVTKIKPDFDYILIGKDLLREELYSKIDKRVEEWFEEGFYEEVEELLKSGVSLEWLERIGLEYRILAQYITQKSGTEQSSVCHCDDDVGGRSNLCNKDCRASQRNGTVRSDKSFDEMKQEMKYSIHHYARRQLTWWRRFEVRWLETTEQAVSASQEFLKGS